MVDTSKDILESLTTYVVTIDRPHIENLNRCSMANILHVSRVSKTRPLVTRQPYNTIIIACFLIVAKQ